MSCAIGDHISYTCMRTVHAHHCTPCIHVSMHTSIKVASALMRRQDGMEATLRRIGTERRERTDRVTVVLGSLMVCMRVRDEAEAEGGG